MQNESKIPNKTNIISPKIRTIIFCLQIAFVLTLLIVWFSSEQLQQSKNLWVFFLYTFPSNFLIAVVPFDPAVLFFGKFHPPLNVVLTGITGMLLTEALNYSVFKFITDTKTFHKIKLEKYLKKIVDLFNKAPFPALMLAGFLPIPFYPLRFLVVIARYPLSRYLLAIFLSKFPRYYLIALFGNKLKVSDNLFLIVFIAFTLLLYFPFFINALKKRLKKKNHSREDT